jgi:hypothetical protein
LADLPQRPAHFNPDPAAVTEFEFRVDGAAGSSAWYREGREAPVMGLRVTKDRLLPQLTDASHPAILSADGMLVRHLDGSVEAIQAEDFASRFHRCLSDGSELCALSASPRDQAKALLELSADNTARNERLLTTSTLRAMFLWRRMRREKDLLKVRSIDLKAHIADLSRKPRAVA